MLSVGCQKVVKYHSLFIKNILAESCQKICNLTYLVRGLSEGCQRVII